MVSVLTQQLHNPLVGQRVAGGVNTKKRLEKDEGDGREEKQNATQTTKQTEKLLTIQDTMGVSEFYRKSRTDTRTLQNGFVDTNKTFTNKQQYEEESSQGMNSTSTKHIGQDVKRSTPPP